MDTNKIKKIVSDRIVGWHLIIIGLFLVGFGVFSILKIKNSQVYSLRSIILGIMFLIGGIAWYIFK